MKIAGGEEKKRRVDGKILTPGTPGDGSGWGRGAGGAVGRGGAGEGGGLVEGGGAGVAGVRGGGAAALHREFDKERSTWNLLGREEKQFDWGRRRGYPRLDPPWGVRGSNHILRTSGLRSITKKTNHCSQFENQWGLLKDDTKERLQT